MSKGSELLKLFQQIDEVNQVVTDIQKRPRSYAGVRLYANESKTLDIIARQEGLSQAELSGRMLRTKGATSAAVNRLVEKRLVLRERMERDQRRYLLTLTDLGRRVDAARQRYGQIQAYTMAEQLSVSQSDLETANDVLHTLLMQLQR